MAGKSDSNLDEMGGLFAQILQAQTEAAHQMMEPFVQGAFADGSGNEHRPSPLDKLGEALAAAQKNWFSLFDLGDFSEVGTMRAPPPLSQPEAWADALQNLAQELPLFNSAKQAELWSEAQLLWQDIQAQYDAGPESLLPDLPRKDRRFADPSWRETAASALIHQTYLLFVERIGEALESGGREKQHKKLRFATQTMLDALSPANFPLINPQVLARTIESEGANLRAGLERITKDIEAGLLTHTDKSQFTLGENIAATPGKVIYRSQLFELIQYSPTTPEVLATPLLIFPPWINRFYILDLNAKKSFVRWAVAQGLTVVMVSWRSADESMAHIDWDQYIAAQIEAIDVTCERLKVADLHTIGYCVAGTTLAATLAVLAERDQAQKVKSVTFLNAQVDFSDPGELAVFVDDAHLEMIAQASKSGVFDGRYMASIFNLLRSGDLIWSYVVNHYLLGEDYSAFDLLYWNGDVTNLPAKWHRSYLTDLYRDNLMVDPRALCGDGTDIDLTQVKTPSYVQAAREDHIAPPQSVYKILNHFTGPMRFVLAGSGHIAGVVNPPEARKYQYWTLAAAQMGTDYPETLDGFIEAAQETTGSWWPDWLAWIEVHNPAKVKAIGARRPGSKANPAIEDAPGSYVRKR